MADKLVHLWLDEIIFTFHWWLGLLLIIIPWTVWLKLHNKKNRHGLLYAGLAVALIASYLDFLGIELALWHYNIKLLPTIPGFWIWDFSLLPVEIMLLLQIKPKLSPYIKGAFHALLTSLVFEPFFIWIDFYHPIHWKSIYSIPIQFLIFLLANYLYKKSCAEKENFG